MMVAVTALLESCALCFTAVTATASTVTRVSAASRVIRFVALSLALRACDVKMALIRSAKKAYLANLLNI